ncbi:MAG: hypothetical protein LBK56_05880 [Gracilibacteraceae bacterium]|nr:hypothetical protein [Gracilibacteraceae bacterium]
MKAKWTAYERFKGDLERCNLTPADRERAVIQHCRQLTPAEYEREIRQYCQRHRI